MDAPEVRPKLEFTVTSSADVVLDQVRRALDQHRDACTGRVLGSTVEIGVVATERHFWSPQLSLQVESHEDGGAIIYGRIGPQPHVWTMLVAGYAIFGFSALFASFFAYSQWRLARPMWALWVVGFGVGMAGVVYGTARVGQRLGADQTERLYRLLRDSGLPSPRAER
ncbi:MAG: hypothetical protein AAF928_03820 [Myxococcota bacterium]